MTWLGTPVTIPAGVIVLFFSMFAAVTGALIRVLMKMLARFFDQQTILMEMTRTNDRALAVAEKKVHEGG